MKTQTSKTRMWLSSLLLLPIIAILFYSFAEKEYVEKEPSETPEVLQLENTSNSEKLTQQKPPTEKEISAYNAWAKKIHSESQVLSKNATFFPPINSKQDLIKFSKLYKKMSPQQKKESIEFPFPSLDAKDSEHSFPLATPTQQEKATAKQIAAYNTWAKSINQQIANTDANSEANAYPIVKVKEVNKYSAIYNIMTEAQRKNSEAWPSFPPPPPRPPAPKSKDKTENSQNKNTIQPVEITIKKDNSLVLNGDPIKFEELTAAVNKLNSHLTIKEKRSYVTASIKLETNDSKDLAKKIGQELTKVDVFSNCIIFNNEDEQQKITSNHISPNAGLTIEEVKAQQEKDLKAYEESLESKKNKTKSPWSIDMGVTSVKAINDSLHKQGPIEINGATYYFTQQNGKTTYYDSYGKVVDINKIPPPPPIPNDATQEQKAKMKKATDAYMKANSDNVEKAKLDDDVIEKIVEVPSDLQGSVDINGETFYYTTSHGKTTYFNLNGKEVEMDNLPPPPPSRNPSFLEYIIEMEEKGATFYMDGKKITANEAKAIAKNNKGKGTDMITQKDENGKYVVKLSNQIID